jgi:hypothetical protein
VGFGCGVSSVFARLVGEPYDVGVETIVGLYSPYKSGRYDRIATDRSRLGGECVDGDGSHHHS